MIVNDSDALLPLQRTVYADGPSQVRRSGWVAQFDASTSGGGAVLRCGETIMSYTYLQWQPADAEVLGAHPGDSAFQSFWEMVMLLICLILWGDDFVAEDLLVVGDSTSALQNALDLKGKGIMAAVAREISWRQARAGWRFVVGHIPAERNTVPDALSRVFEPHDVPPFPHEAVGLAHFREPPCVQDLWKAVAFPRA